MNHDCSATRTCRPRRVTRVSRPARSAAHRARSTGCGWRSRLPPEPGRCARRWRWRTSSAATVLRFRQAQAEHLGRTERRVMAAIEACRTAALGGADTVIRSISPSYGGASGRTTPSVVSTSSIVNPATFSSSRIWLLEAINALHLSAGRSPDSGVASTFNRQSLILAHGLSARAAAAQPG